MSARAILAAMTMALALTACASGLERRDEFVGGYLARYGESRAELELMANGSWRSQQIQLGVDAGQGRSGTWTWDGTWLELTTTTVPVLPVQRLRPCSHDGSLWLVRQDKLDVLTAPSRLLLQLAGWERVR